jgi:hypothetical protein
MILYDAQTDAEIGYYYCSKVLETRRYGKCYLHSKNRATVTLLDGSIEITHGSWGRSLNSGGHKYKVWANYSDSGKPVPTKILVTLLAQYKVDLSKEKENAK